MNIQEISNRMSNLFRLLKAEKGVKQKELAELLHVSANTISAWKDGTMPKFKHLLLLKDKFQVNLSWLLDGVGEPFEESTHLTPDNVALEMIPLVAATLSAGGGSFEIDGNVKRYLAFRHDFLDSKGCIKEMVLMTVAGDSMEPEIKDSDVVLIDQSQTSLRANSIYAIAFQDMVYLKRINALPDKIVLESINKEYAPISVEPCDMDNMRIIGRAIWWCQEAV